MAEVTDIPERGGEDGATQLDLLRSYLKDLDSLGYKYTDEMLITLLISSDRNTVWRTLMGYPSTANAWTYEITLSTHVSRLRFHTGDTDEGSLRYTDYELTKYLNKYPLRYVIALVVASGTTGIYTDQTDPNHPLFILRGTVDGQGVLAASSAYSDEVLANLLLTSGLNPYELAINIFDASVRGTVIARSDSTTAGSGFASLDGISFAKEGSAEQMTALQRAQDRQTLIEQMMASVYSKESPYDVVVDGESTVFVEEGDWYAL